MGTNLKNSDRKRKIDQGGRTKRRFDFLQMILKTFDHEIGDGEPTPFFFDNFFSKKLRESSQKTRDSQYWLAWKGNSARKRLRTSFGWVKLG